MPAVGCIRLGLQTSYTEPFSIRKEERYKKKSVYDDDYPTQQVARACLSPAYA